MRTLYKVGCALTLTALLTLPAATQQQQRQRGQGFGFGGFGGFGRSLVENRSVQEELKLTKEQTDKIAAAVEKQSEARRGLFAKLQDVPREERREKFEALTKASAEANRKLVTDVLNPEQQKRLRQIELQQRGALALTEPDVEKALKITDAQKEKLKTIAADSRKEQEDARSAGGNDFRATFQKIAALRRESNERSMAILTDDQRAALKELTGAPFEVRYEGGQGGFRQRNKNKDN